LIDPSIDPSIDVWSDINIAGSHRVEQYRL